MSSDQLLEELGRVLSAANPQDPRAYVIEYLSRGVPLPSTEQVSAHEPEVNSTDPLETKTSILARPVEDMTRPISQSLEDARLGVYTFNAPKMYAAGYISITLVQNSWRYFHQRL